MLIVFLICVIVYVTVRLVKNAKQKKTDYY